ncbi:MAG: prepilin-type N-terminal cleavage/methylation domain-containing protein [Erysipelotrichales bacterium]|nr:prepilin-type N-terminal cleavage/methylation domain-containing protein [Erysipelotrichales bacterium]
MRKNAKKGFTLIELLITIILLGIIGGIVIYNMSNISTTSKEKEYDNFIAKVKSAASVYADMYPAAFNELYISRAYIYITTGDLISNGLLKDDLVNPYTSERIGAEELIKASLDSTNGSVTFEYPLGEVKQEESLVALNDYVVYGEPYDCMRGIGSYELALSDEEGNLIDLSGIVNGVSNIEKYNFTCTMPEGFIDASKDLNATPTGEDMRTCGSESCSGLSTTVPGNYEIVYNWITEAGVKKQATRTLRVLAKAVPTFKMSAADYDFETTNNPSDDKFAKNTNGNLTCSNCDAQNFYQTKLTSKNNNTWDVLTYQPYVEGADTSTTSFRIRKRVNNPTPGNYVDVTDGFINDFNFTQQVDDGDKTYELTVKVTGHYNKNYTYQAVGYGRFKAELVVPEEYISATNMKNNNTVWSTNNTYLLDSDESGKQSPVGIQSYEFKLSNEDLDKSLGVEQSNLFNKVAKITQKPLTVLDGVSCIDSKSEYTYVYFRAKNNDGYVGAWVRYSAKLTNSVSKILEEYANNGGACKSVSGECYFTSKQVYIKLKNQLFNVLSRYKDNTVLLTLDKNTGVAVDPLSLRKGYAEQQTCDGLFYKHYDYYVANDAIMNEVKRWANAYFSNYKKILTPAIPGGTSTVATTYTSALFSKYQAAAVGKPEYWLLDQGSTKQIVYLDEPRKHGNESTTVYNAYFYYVSNMSVNAQYAGKSSYVKPIARFKDLYICSGDGTASNPYNAV